MQNKKTAEAILIMYSTGRDVSDPVLVLPRNYTVQQCRVTSNLLICIKQPTPLWNPLFIHAWQIGMLVCFVRTMTR
nr:MAG TPA: hypothetical protein [Caudoviricetes sp.]